MREPVPSGVFADDQYQLSVNFGEEAPPGPGLEQAFRSKGDPGSSRVVATIVSDPDEGSDLDEEQNSEDPPGPEGDRRVPFLNWIVDGSLPPGQTEARRLTWKAKSYKVIEGNLYRQSHNGVLQQCILNGEGRSLLKDIHGRICGHHMAPRSLVSSTFDRGSIGL